MKFLLDSCISSFAVNDLKAAGFNVFWIPELGMDTGDEAVLKKTFDERSVLVTAVKILVNLSLSSANHILQ